MHEYQIEARSRRNIRVGRDGETVAAFRPKRFIADLRGEVEGDASEMRLPAPWRGFRYRLEQGGREIASAARPKVKQRIVSIDVEMPGRKLELVAQDPEGLEYLLTEGGQELGRFTQRNFGEQDEWTADFRAREEAPGLAAFVAWLVVEARAFRR